MIRHIVLFSAKNSSDLPRIEAALNRLRQIPDLLKLEVARNARHDALSGEIDLIVYAEFASYAQLEQYKNHALYHEAIRVVRPLRDIRIAVDFESGIA